MINGRLRALLVLATLVSLCVSDTVGPRLLPLPGAAASHAANGRALEAVNVTPASSAGSPY